MSDLQSGITVAEGAITGTLKYVDSGALATDWGAGNFMALKFTPSALDENVVKYRVGLDPSEGSGFVELDSDMDGVFKVTDKSEQVFVVETVGRDYTTRQEYDLSGLTTLAE